MNVHQMPTRDAGHASADTDSACLVQVVGFRRASGGGGLVGWCALSFDTVVVQDVAIRRNNEGKLWVALPSKPPKEGDADQKWKPIVSFRKDAREALTAAIVEQVEALLAKGGAA